MRFDDLDAKMRIFETAHDHCVLPHIYMVARLDGRNFTKLTKESDSFEAPFDLAFRNMMVETTSHLMNCGFNIIYGYTESDEISLLFHQNDDTFNRKLRKLTSILAGEASAKFTYLLSYLFPTIRKIVCFDCRISQLPSVPDVIDYFRWRQEDAHRNSLNAHCYWFLRNVGKSPKEATKFLLNMSVAEKNEFLFQQDINYNDLPNWQKRGIGIIWKAYEKIGTNPKTNQQVTTMRKELKTNYDLPIKDEYDTFIVQHLIKDMRRIKC